MAQQYTPPEDFPQGSFSSKNEDRIEVTQQQASFGAAFILLLIFFACLAGYFGAHTQADYEREVIFSEFPFESREQRLKDADKQDALESELSKNMQNSPIEKTYSAELASLPTKHSAQVLCELLRKKGINCTYKERESSRVAREAPKGGAPIRWYSIHTEEYEEGIAVQALVRKALPLLPYKKCTIIEHERLKKN